MEDDFFFDSIKYKILIAREIAPVTTSNSSSMLENGSEKSAEIGN